MKSKKNKISNIKKTPKPEMPSAVDDAANVMSKYSSKENKFHLKIKNTLSRQLIMKSHLTFRPQKKGGKNPLFFE
tara:strand:- start:1941 stop:2165 length:225 start_codon:yes stop_codon:yes gene_type:complete